MCVMCMCCYKSRCASCVCAVILCIAFCKVPEFITTKSGQRMNTCTSMIHMSVYRFMRSNNANIFTHMFLNGSQCRVYTCLDEQTPRPCPMCQQKRRECLNVAGTCDAAPAYRPLTLPVPAQESQQQPDHDAACGRVPGPHVADRAVSKGVWALPGHVGIDVFVCVCVCLCVRGMWSMFEHTCLV